MRKDIGILLLAGFLFFIYGNWILSITSPDEGRNAYAALHMLKSGDWIAPYYNCEPRFAKPPLLYWLTALFFKVFGINEFAARLTSGLAATFTSVVIYLIVRDFFSKEKALLAGLIFALFIHTWVEARAVVPEMLLVFFSTLGVYLFLKGKILWGWLALALAFLTKGPVGVILPLAVVFLWELSEGGKNIKQQLKEFFIRTFHPLGILIFVLVGGSWYFAMLAHFGWEYFYKFFVVENIARFTGQAHQHPYPWWYYIPIFLLSVVLFLPVFGKVIFNFERKFLPPLLWFLFVFTFYSLAKNKLHHYILFAYPPVAIILALYVSKTYLKRVMVLGSTLLGLLLIAALWFEQQRFVPKAVDYLKKENPPTLVFYKDENSAIVFYLYRCIPIVEDRNKLPPEGFLITKEKHLKDLKNFNCKVVVEGREFGKREVLCKFVK